jgi:hypothetical protein
MKIDTVAGSKYWAKNECKMMIIMRRRNKHPSSSANRASNVTVTVNINAEFKLSLV